MKRVQFRHPQTGKPHTGRLVHKPGRHGVTVQDDEGATHRVHHGHYVEHSGSGGPSHDEGRAKAKEHSDAGAGFAELRRHHAEIPKFRAHAYRDLRLGATSPIAARAACALLTQYAGRHIHHITANEIKVDGTKVSVRAASQPHHEVEDARLAAWLRAALEGREVGQVFEGAGHDGSPRAVEADHVEEYLKDHLGAGMDGVRGHHATRRWSKEVAELGRPKTKQQAERHAERAAFKSGVELDDVDATTRKAHGRYGVVPKSMESHDDFGGHLDAVKRSDPFDDHHQP